MSRLTLGRKLDESIIIYTDEGLVIEVQLTAIHAGQARILIDAPTSVHIDRKEIYLRKQLEKAPS
jgi:carbon storage regulator CsrA